MSPDDIFSEKLTLKFDLEIGESLSDAIEKEVEWNTYLEEDLRVQRR